MSVKTRILNILFWSVISAAFIGPGTVTTATKAGADHKLSLLWALTFSVLACIVLQEASARLSITSGKNLGEAIRESLRERSARSAMLLFTGASILTGIIAYQAGNLLGAVSGMTLIIDMSPRMYLLIIGLLAGIVLNIPGLQIIARILGALVAVMGIFFVAAAIHVRPDPGELITGLFVPHWIPESNAGLLILGLIGTTVVPYNLFLGSGITQKGQTIREMRAGLYVAVILGGIISMAVLITGTHLAEFDSFRSFAANMETHLGRVGKYILGFGLFGAGFTSAVTAPLAASITFRSLWGDRSERWSTRSLRFKSVWLTVLLTGIVLGLTNAEPIPVIILAQALNGLILPVIAVYLLLLLNNNSIVGPEGLNSWLNNMLMAIIAGVTMIIGLTSLIRALAKGLDVFIPDWNLVLIINCLISVVIILFVMMRISFELRTKKNP